MLPTCFPLTPHPHSPTSKPVDASAASQRSPVASILAHTSGGCCLCILWRNVHRGSPWISQSLPISGPKTPTCALGSSSQICWVPCSRNWWLVSLHLDSGTELRHSQTQSHQCGVQTVYCSQGNPKPEAKPKFLSAFQTLLHALGRMSTSLVDFSVLLFSFFFLPLVGLGIKSVRGFAILENPFTKQR